MAATDITMDIKNIIKVMAVTIENTITESTTTSATTMDLAITRNTATTTPTTPVTDTDYTSPSSIRISPSGSEQAATAKKLGIESSGIKGLDQTWSGPFLVWGVT